MARYASEPSPSQMHLVRGVNPLKPLIFYIPHGNSPCFGTYHLEIPHEKLILVWYFPLYKNNQNFCTTCLYFCPYDISPCFGICHLEICNLFYRLQIFPNEKSILVWYFPINAITLKPIHILP